MTDNSADADLVRAHEALELGDIEQATYLARQVLRDAQDRRDGLDEGRALACLAQCDRQLSRLRRAHGNSQRAVHLLREAQDLAGEVMALTTLAHTAASLGRVDEAMESALLAVSLSESLPPSRLQPLAHNYLGTVFFWCKDFGQAEAAFERSADLVHASESTVSPLQPLLNLAFLEAYRFAVLRFEGLPPVSVGKLEARLVECAEAIAHQGDESLMPGMTVAVRTLVHVFHGLAATWSRDLDTASAEMLWCEAWETRYGQNTWLSGMRRWLETEVAWTCGDIPLAVALAHEMVATSAQAEHEELACLGHLIVATLERSRADSQAESNELLRLRRREQAIRIEALDSRARAVEWQMQARASANHIERLASRSRMLERLSLEDSLTGLPNRRSLDRRLLARAAHESCIALIDVDRFKLINDGFSHHVGDRVLKVVADTLSHSVRAGDFVARMAGDEFVVLFDSATLTEAQHICTRMKAAVQAHDWDAIAPGLRVSISVGLEQAKAGESMHALLQRSDGQMYADKRAGTPG